MAGARAGRGGAGRAGAAGGARGAGLACGATQKVLRTKRFTRNKRTGGEEGLVLKGEDLGVVLRENVEGTQFGEYPHHREFLRVAKADGEYLQAIPERFGNYWGKALPLPDNHPRTGNIVFACVLTIGLGAYLDFGGATAPSFTWGLLAVIFSLLAYDPKSGNSVPFYPYGGGLKFRKAAPAPVGVAAGKKSGEAPPKLSTKKVRAPPALKAAAAAAPGNVQEARSWIAQWKSKGNPAGAKVAPKERASAPAAAAAAPPAEPAAAPAAEAGESDADREARLSAVLDGVDAEAPAAAAAAGEAATAGGSGDADVEEAKQWLEDALAEEGGEGEGEQKSGGFKMPFGKKD